MSLLPLWVSLLLSAVPLFEGRYAIPVAILLGLSPPLAYLLCTAANLAVIPAVLLGMEAAAPHLRRRWKGVDRLFRFMVRKRLRGRHFAALFAFVALPLPGTGAYTGTILACMLGMKGWRPAATVALGVLAANALTALAAAGLSLWL